MFMEKLGGLADSGPQALRRLETALRVPLENILAGGEITPDAALALLTDSSPESLHALCYVASVLRDRGRGRTVTFSPKVFIPLTRLCRDFCSYCTFRQEPADVEHLYMTPEQVLAVARAGERAGCTEALFTLGERPEQRYPEAKRWLEQRGYKSTHEYLADMCRLVATETRLLPHVNPGTMTMPELQLLRPVSVSMGMMLESTAEHLVGPGGPHEFAPSKHPRARLKTLERAGRAAVAFTTGILIGIGETPADRIESLFAIKRIHERYGHIQEVIVQNFRAKDNTRMAAAPEPGVEEVLRTVAVARLILGPDMNLQVPPNLTAAEYPTYLLGGINDWGGISPVTIDYVNPEAPWPAIVALRQATEFMGFTLRPRLPIYPEFVRSRSELIPEPLWQRVKDLADDQGYVKHSDRLLGGV